MSIAIIVPEINNRLKYTCDWIFAERLGVTYKLFLETPAENNYQLLIDYSNEKQHFSIPNFGLLFSKKIETTDIIIGDWQAIPTLFASKQKDLTIPFDLFSAVFYLLSRFEEYLPFSPDKHNRFAATESILFKEQILERPIVDEWIYELRKKIEESGVTTQSETFEYLPSYDIDIAWQYKQKGLKRTIGGYFKSLLGLKFQEIIERTQVLLNSKKDAYDSFELIQKLEVKHNYHSLVFVLAAEKNTEFDKNCSVKHPKMKALIKSLSRIFELGIHPSYNSNQLPKLFLEEKTIVELISQQPINKSRQHYIKLSLPDTYRHLISIGIKSDYSMGYGSHLGFRAGTSRAFFWYDLQNEQVENLKIIPFSFMDTSAHYELGLNCEEAFKRLTLMQNKLEKVGGKLVTIFHNFSLGTAAEWEGWNKAYTAFLNQNNKRI